MTARQAFNVGFLSVGALSMIIMSHHYLHNGISGIMVGKEVSDFSWYRLSFKAHVLGGLVAIATGAIQLLLLSLNKWNVTLHRQIGTCYLLSVALSGIAGLIVAQFAIGGMMSTLGFSMLAICWLVTAFLAYSSIRKHQIRLHKQWIYLNYSFTFAAITQRTMLLIPLLTEVSFIPIYRWSAWLPWILNGCLAVYFFRRSERLKAIKQN